MLSGELQLASDLRNCGKNALNGGFVIVI